LRKYSDGFNEKFNFFLKSYRTGLLTFCGEDVQVQFDSNGVSCKEGFRLYDDGHFKHGKVIKSRHPNILRSVIIGKKSWGLHVRMWSQGIADWCFTKDELLVQFSEKCIKIPDSFLLDFDNQIKKFKEKRYI